VSFLFYFPNSSKACLFLRSRQWVCLPPSVPTTHLPKHGSQSYLSNHLLDPVTSLPEPIHVFPQQ
jgi:hypothetical protein